MAELSTLAMQEFSEQEQPEGTLPGFVLLYAKEYDQLPAAWPISGDRAIIGREGDLRIPKIVQSVSRRHAEVQRQGDQWILRDLGSRNGTLVDGQRITEIPLEPLHEVRLGDVILKFVDTHAESYGRYRIDGMMLGSARRMARHPTTMVGGFQIDRIAARLERAATTLLSVLIRGETGTGKEVAAREIHRVSGRQGPFVPVNCAAIPATLIESELFGYRRGAFSGADRDKEGLVQSADTGTLFLDEIGDMPLEAQAKLLRVLQAREVTPLGGTKAEPIDLRVVTATHRDLRLLQKEQKFREDLYARINEYQVPLPALRERKEDVFLLLRSFLAKHGSSGLTPTFRFMTALTHYDWAYNVRELEACAKRAIALVEGTSLDVGELPPEVEDAMRNYGAAFSQVASMPASQGAEGGMPSEDNLRELLEQHAGNVAAVGRQLGKARMQVHRWMRKYGIQPDDYRH